MVPTALAASWLAEFLRERGVSCREVSSPSGVLNEGCGAGDLSPTATWTHQEVEASSHMLLKALKPAPEGQLVGAALDGDGDRCLFIQATETGFAVVDGDAMAAMLLGAAADRPWSFAASIESDVALFGHVQSLNAETECIETAVGDRWLSYALRPSEGGWLHDATMPASCGIEDSGHVVLPAPHPTVDDAWSLVGDGAATLCAVLLAAAQQTDAVFDCGWKNVSPSKTVTVSAGRHPASSLFRQQRRTSEPPWRGWVLRHTDDGLRANLTCC